MFARSPKVNKKLDDPEEGGEACRNRVQNHSHSRWGSWCRSSWRPDRTKEGPPRVAGPGKSRGHPLPQTS